MASNSREYRDDEAAQPLLISTSPTATDDLESQPQQPQPQSQSQAQAQAQAQGQDDEDTIPFPSQPDPARPFRPRNYAAKRSFDRLHSWADKNTGFLLLALAQLFYATMSLFFKILNDLPPSSGQGKGQEGKGQAIGALQVIVVRMAVTAAGCYIYLIFIARDPHPFLGPPPVRRLLAFRGFSGFFGLFGLYFSLQYLSLADATVITFLSPLATAIIAAAFLKEQLHSRQLVAGLVSVLGVVLIARPQFLFGGRGGPGGGDLDELPIPGGDEGGAIGTGAISLFGGGGVPTRTLGSDLEAVVVAAAGPIAGPINAVVAAAAAAALSTSAAIFPSPTTISSTALSYLPTPAPTLPAATAAAAATTLVSVAHHSSDVTEPERVLAVAIALLGVLGSAGAYTSLRCIGHRASPTHSVAYFSTWSLFVASLAMLITGQQFVMPTDWRWGVLMLFIGLCGLVAQILAAMGLAREKAGRATVAVYLQAPISVFYQLILLQTPLEPLSALGSGIILLASIWVTMGK
ncbi:unnamed protein product [Tilletia laevis]|uniref:EamA domain-containing protein n=3 Tax=Tilletia TaxID=13289 RepID=A0A8X7SZ05_9BASI|nr:hypothetical protein CF328_g5172 [Tilletia controversa]KAE8196226.1 hypothetical protein CF335_g4908 [Tilletia laevis]KAE8256949.1 hypothetical protein A4X03_0g4894 [Tilletia caries]KAE8197147.1 hypothetical protein CF336_g2282 [Tilletia laevis]KAE8252975.1 hypothetical protein A4X06_0g1788 [Tilletia controversa]